MSFTSHHVIVIIDIVRSLFVQNTAPVYIDLKVIVKTPLN
jgi:hypothetical protein